jgi:chromosomal replication initiator protein
MNKDFKQVWHNCLAILRDNLPPVTFRTWFEPIVPVKLEANVLTIQVPSPFFYEYLEEQFIDLLSKILRKEIGPDAKLEYSVVMDNSRPQSNGNPYTVKYPTQNKQVPHNSPVNMPASKENEIRNPFIIPGIQKVHVHSQLNPDYNFQSFIEGECNRLARTAGITVACNPGGTTFNPLMLHSDSGLGKTHLAQAIGIAIKERFPEKIVLYVTAHRFQTQFIEAVRNNNKNDFMHFYQMIDVLIIDDVQEFAGKEKTQNTFFHIFNHLHQSGKQLILTADKAPVEMKGFEKRLLSRFKWGLTADLQIPDFATRVNILRQRIYRDGIDLSPEIIDYIASHVTTSVRELEGALISLLAHSTLNKREITLELAQQSISKIIKNTKREVTIDLIEKVVCEYFNMPTEVLHSNTRKREIVQVRQIAMYFSKSQTKESLSTIGLQLGGKDHATVLHAFKTVTNLMDTDKNFKRYIDDISLKLKQ